MLGRTTTAGRVRTRLLAALSGLVAAPVGAAVLGPAQEAVGVQVLPSGFALHDLATGQGAWNLTDFGFLPDGSVLTIGRNGRVTRVPRGGSPATIRTFPTETAGNLGLVGLAIAPGYRRSHHVFLVRAVPSASAPPYTVRLSRFTVRGGRTPTGLAHEKVLLSVRSPQPEHGMTSVLPARDGTLWVSIGDLRGHHEVVPGALEARAIGRPAGKLLHIRSDGAGVRTNPFYRPARPLSWRSRTWASGFRSPFRLSLDPRTGHPIVGDVGWKTWEEVDVVRRGRDYGWPCWEGPVRTPGYSSLSRCAHVPNTRPVWSYQHGTGSGQGDAVTGGIVYTGNRYPQRYRGAYFFGDWVGQKLWTMRISPSGRLERRPEDPPFGTDIGAPVRFAAAPDGDIVYADMASGKLRRLTH